jgi:hypothetical protein
LEVVTRPLFLKKYKLETRIASYCRIQNNSVFVNGQPFFKSDEKEDLPVFLAGLYKTLGLNYPKFFKMDKLCKLGVAATDLVIKGAPGFELLPKNEMALIFANNSSSLESDRAHASTISDKRNYFPSPSVFVYTLPNIVVGEIAIKHKITGENAFFVSEKFDADLMFSYCDILFQSGSATSAICGWVNVDANSAEAFVYCVKNLNFKQENNSFQKPHNPGNIQELYSLSHGSTGNN